MSDSKPLFSRVYPADYPTSPKLLNLSIIDATVANFACTGAIWYFDPSESLEVGDAKATLDLLCKSLKSTLTSYPHFAGRLCWSDYDAVEAKHNHTRRYGRVNVLYGGDKESDPGVCLFLATSNEPVPSAIPKRPTSKAESRLQSPSDIREAPEESKRYLPPPREATLFPNTDVSGRGLFGVIIQITSFSCGGLAIAIKMAHCLADAITLNNFVRDWASITRAMDKNEVLPVLAPMIDPQALDRAAAGDIDAAEPHQDLVRISESLPYLMNDWWISECPWSDTATQIPAVLDQVSIEPDGTKMDWSEVDFTRPVKHCFLHFSKEETQKLWQAASRSPSTERISKHDALVAHLWTLINRARGLYDCDEEVHACITFGLRSRLNPPLPNTFLGSPLMLADAHAPGRDLCSSSPIHAAELVHNAVSKFDSRTIPAFLHHKMFVSSPQRFWHAFLSRKYLIFTSWIHTKMYEVDFGWGGPRYMEAIMPKMDGCVQLMEAAPRSGVGLAEKSHWSENGVDVSVHLEAAAMDRLLKDDLLRRYAQRCIHH